jgi:hypothetical protein
MADLQRETSRTDLDFGQLAFNSTLLDGGARLHASDHKLYTTTMKGYINLSHALILLVCAHSALAASFLGCMKGDLVNARGGFTIQESRQACQVSMRCSIWELILILSGLLSGAGRAYISCRRLHPGHVQVLLQCEL